MVNEDAESLAQYRGQWMGQYTPEDCIEVLQAVDDATHGNLTFETYREAGVNPSPSTIASKFDGWNDALESAGIPINNEQSVDPTRDDCINALHEAHITLKHTPTVREYHDLDLTPTYPTIKQHYDSWNSALESAGIPPTTYDQQDCIDALRAARRIIGHSPTVREYERTGITPTAQTIASICGSWNEAKELAGLSTQPTNRY